MNCEKVTGLSGRQIELRGVRVHNLKNIDLDIPHGQLLALCGLSGSGKTSLALDTLFAEGQRRYVECFSTYARQFLDQHEKPDADRIDGVPPAIAVTASKRAGTSRSTVGTVTETIDFLRLLFARVATPVCPDCNLEVTAHSVQSVRKWAQSLARELKFLIGFELRDEDADALIQRLVDARRAGFRRAVVNRQTIQLGSELEDQMAAANPNRIVVIVDRLTTRDIDKPQQTARLDDSLETAFRHGDGDIQILVQSSSDDASANREVIDGETFVVFRFSSRRECSKCSRVFAEPEPNLFSFNSPYGACPTCEGFGSIQTFDMRKIVPDETRTIRQGAIAPWNTPAYRHELDELIELAEDYSFPLDVPFRELKPQHRDLLWGGVKERDFGGLNGFFRWLERRKYKMHLRVFLSRWRSFVECPDCRGRRLSEMSLAYRLNGRNIAELSLMPVVQLNPFLQELELPASAQRLASRVLAQIQQRLQYLGDVGVGYLSLDRTMRTLSDGEKQRVSLTRALGSSLVNLLYVLDEPSSGLHAADVERIKLQIRKLQQRRNTVVMIEHDPEIIQAAERVVEIGPGAGIRGGRIVFDGTPDRILQDETSITGQFMSGRRGFAVSDQKRPATRGSIKLMGARGHNLQNVTVEFPLGLLCLVTGVSGAGKSSLVQRTLGPALLKSLGRESDSGLPYSDLLGAGKIDNVVIIDQSSLARSSRSNPVTYVKAFDEIRKIFAETVDARTRNFKPGHFSFNVEGGRCEKCLGEGYVSIDMQFMADVLRRCDVCEGRRFQADTLKVQFRNRNIAQVLDLTVTEAFTFFRGYKRVQSRLKLLKDVGLEYLQLGQPSSTLSAGEAQRLKLALFLGQASKKRTLFLMDEPTAGLHMADVVRLVDCFNSLIDVGHSLIIVEHDLQLMLHADYVIDMGPGAADKGGRVVATGTPQEISENQSSLTGSFLRRHLSQVAT